MKKITLYLLSLAVALVAGPTLTSCDDTKSYAELLDDENKAVNLYLSNQRVADAIPADSVFEVGPDAPYYPLDDEGNVYMQVLSTGTSEKAEYNDRVYFRYTRYNLFSYADGGTMEGTGNADNIDPAVGMGATYFLFQNFSNQNSAQFGEGLQMPMKFLGYDCKVNLVVKSQYGITQELTNVVPYLYTISYYKPMI